MERFALACTLVQKVGRILRKSRTTAHDVQQKTSPQDLVTHWDKEIEQLLRDGISAAFPQDSIVGEEFPVSTRDPFGATWYLDPIDGTTNFISQHQNYAVSVACWQSDQPLFGLVLDVENSNLYWAKSGEGAWCNDDPIHVSDRTEIQDWIFTTPDMTQAFLMSHPYQSDLIRLAQSVRGVRSLGSVALELCSLASGRADVFAALRSSPWDHNAARIILTEAGGCICDLSGNPLPLGTQSTVFACNSPHSMQTVLQLR